MFFYNSNNSNNSNNSKNQNNIVNHNETRYNLDMMNKVRIKQQQIQRENDFKRNKIKSLKLLQPKYNIRWGQDIFEEIELEEQKKKIKHLKITEPKSEEFIIIGKSDPYYIHDW